MKKYKTQEYKIWKSMKARCYAPSYSKGYNKYQELGIQVCERWLHSFENFLEDMGICPHEFSLERKDNRVDYSPENCVWIPKNEQPKNRLSCHFIEYKGETKILKDWARHFGIKYTTLYLRIFRSNLSFEEAINFRKKV